MVYQGLQAYGRDDNQSTVTVSVKLPRKTTEAGADLPQQHIGSRFIKGKRPRSSQLPIALENVFERIQPSAFEAGDQHKTGLGSTKCNT